MYNWRILEAGVLTIVLSLLFRLKGHFRRTLLKDNRMEVFKKAIILFMHNSDAFLSTLEDFLISFVIYLSWDSGRFVISMIFSLDHIDTGW